MPMMFRVRVRKDPSPRPSSIDVCRGEVPSAVQRDHQWVAEPGEQVEQQLGALADGDPCRNTLPNGPSEQVAFDQSWAVGQLYEG